ncbi:MAG: ABC transporter substrate-binding protein [Clostridia bacterium]|jgi:putative ABC transport system substrate-binding protein|nr:ABC transporter substrate-binding protein [Clostridia bacterium]MDD3094392.1 ABC transporter substrate-binding protein [Clostridia bacterium]MDD3972725.1 ABC transporter substrate-binding protein [Clostridia bacterium]MDD4543213.1 ABC transporter substrate-binding protein [Clostridia bacterium]NLO19268.1 ABC transporter substrate-binding protein [Ignavibacteria bacterium]
MKKVVSLMLALVLCLGSCFALTSCTSNKSDEKYQIGICQLVEHVALDAATDGFMQAIIDELGEDAVEFDVQNGQGDPATCSTIANQFVSNNVDLIMANATPALQSVAAATGDIPILGTSVTEYGVALNLKDFNGTVGGNISGTSDLAPLDKQAAMIIEWVPDAKTVGLLYCSKEANSQYQVEVVKKELENKGLIAKLYPFTDSNDLAQICTAAADNCDVIYVPTDNTVADNTGIIDNICEPKKVPVIAGEEGICAVCGIATLSISYYDLGYTTGMMAVRILRDGADISTMPIEYADKQTPKYNKQNCEALGITPLEGYIAIDEN